MLLHLNLGCGCEDYHSAMQEYHNGGALAALNAPALVKWPHILWPLYNCAVQSLDLMAPIRWQPIHYRYPPCLTVGHLVQVLSKWFTDCITVNNFSFVKLLTCRFCCDGHRGADVILW